MYRLKKQGFIFADEAAVRASITDAKTYTAIQEHVVKQPGVTFSPKEFSGREVSGEVGYNFLRAIGQYNAELKRGFWVNGEKVFYEGVPMTIKGVFKYFDEPADTVPEATKRQIYEGLLKGRTRTYTTRGPYVKYMEQYHQARENYRKSLDKMLQNAEPLKDMILDKLDEMSPSELSDLLDDVDLSDFIYGSPEEDIEARLLVRSRYGGGQVMFHEAEQTSLSHLLAKLHIPLDTVIHMKPKSWGVEQPDEAFDYTIEQLLDLAIQAEIIL